MTLVGREVMEVLSPDAGVLCLLIIVILSILLSTLCLDCGRRSFELRDPDVERNPSTLVRVVKLEEAMAARVNPMIHEIQNDEMESTTSAESGLEDNSTWYQPWRSHLQSPEKSVVEQIGNGSPGAVKMRSSSPPTDTDIEPLTTVNVAEPHLLSSLPPSTTTFTSTLDPEGPHQETLGSGVGQNQGPWAPPEVQPQHIYDIIREKEESVGGGGGNPPAEMEISSQEPDPDLTANHEPVQSSAEEAQEWSDREWNPMYARVSKKSERPSPPPIPPPDDKEKAQDVEEQEVSPPLPEKSLVE